MLKYNRFRQRVDEDAAGATWVEDADFDIANHVVREKLPKVQPLYAQADKPRERFAPMARGRN